MAKKKTKNKTKKKISKKISKKLSKKTIRIISKKTKKISKKSGVSKTAKKVKVKALVRKPVELETKKTLAVDKKVYKPLTRCLTRKQRKDGALEIMLVGDEIQIYVVRGVASYVWGQLDGINSMGAILAQVLDLYDVTERQARTDISNFVTSLLKMKLIEQV